MIFAAACLVLAGCGIDGASTSFQPAPGSPFRIGEGVSRPALGDVNRDGHIDVVLGCGNERGASFVVLLGDGKGGFRNIQEHVGLALHVASKSLGHRLCRPERGRTDRPAVRIADT
jgi:hypothetical protein